MCGILGSINISSTSTYLDLIRHRGPDSSGKMHADVSGNSVELLHRRLSILDLSEAGNQPMYSFDKKHCIVFNGEIYNHLTLRNEIQDLRFEGHSDTETIVNYFRNFTVTGSIAKLNGIFAFAHLDMETHTLYLARDRYGVKPLYYYFGDNQLLFSSEIKPLRSFLKSKMDVGSLAMSIQIRHSPSPMTIYENIFKIEPGQLITINLESEIFLSKSDFVKKPKSIGTKKREYKEIVKKYGDLFEKAVERQLMSDVEIGILLSGGVDSALIAAIASKKSTSKIKTFSIGYDGNHTTMDETENAAETANILGLDHYSKKIDFSDFLSKIRQVVEIVEEPIGTTSIVPMFFLSQLAASKVKVVLSGQGADEPLGGYNKYKVLPWIAKSRLFKGILTRVKIGDLFEKNEKIRRLISSIQCSDDIDCFINFNSITSGTQTVKLLNAKSNVASEPYLENQIIFRNRLKKIAPAIADIQNLFLYYDLRTSLADDLLMYTDKISMHFSLECRVPILDNELIDYIEGLHHKYKFNLYRSKIIHKDFAKEYLPSTVLKRKKLGFQTPTELWFRKHKREIENVLVINREFNNFFDINEVQNLLNRHSNGENLEKQIFLLLSISFLLQ